MSMRYASAGTDKTFRWKWMAATQDAVTAFTGRYTHPTENKKDVPIKNPTVPPIPELPLSTKIL